MGDEIFNVLSLLSEDVRDDRAPQIVTPLSRWRGKCTNVNSTNRNTRGRCMHALARLFSRARDSYVVVLPLSLFHSSLRCLSRSRFRPVYLYRVYRKIVCHRIADYSSRKIDPRKAGRNGTRQIENCGGAMAVARAGERNERKKAHFRGGLSAGDVRCRHIAKGNICSGRSFFWPGTHTRGRSPSRRRRRRRNDCVL